MFLKQRQMFRNLRTASAFAPLLVLVALLAIGTDAHAAKKSAFANTCNPAGISAAYPGFPSIDAWRSPKRYRFPFNGWTPGNKKNTVLWKKIAGSKYRKTHYPAPNLPSCRIGLHGSEDRTSRKAGRYFEMPRSLDGYSFVYQLVDTFGRDVTTIHWEDDSLIRRHPERWGWYVGSKWAGHDATRAFELQGNACKLTPQPITTVVNGQAVTNIQWVRDPNYVMIAFNPGLGSPNKKYRPNQYGALKVRAFVDRRMLPGALSRVADRYDFSCGASALPVAFPTQTLGYFNFKSGYGPDNLSIVGQYFGEGASHLDLIPGEHKLYNNMPYDAYNPKPQFNNAVYAMNNTTGIAGGGMVRGIVRAGVDDFTLLDKMNYCDTNFTLRYMYLKRNGQRVSKANYFSPAASSRKNRPTVRWVFGRITPNPSTIGLEGQLATQNPASAALYAWMPIPCK